MKANNAANGAAARKALEAGLVATTATVGGGKSVAGATATAANIEKALAALDLGSVEIVNYARGQKEITAANRFNKGVKLCFSDMPGSDAPCFFFWMGKSGCGPAPGKEAKYFACANCQRSTTTRTPC